MFINQPKAILLWCCLGLFFSCNQEEEQPFANPTQIDTYFSITGHLEEAIPMTEGMEVRKLMEINEKEDTVVFRPHDQAWREELDVFFQADINKAALVASYSAEEAEGKLIHRLLPGEKAPVKEIIVDKSNGSVTTLRFFSKKENMFYTSETYGEIVTSSRGIASYQISGKQKVWFMPYNEMEVKAEVVW